jgi:serine/threonine protein phosphatase 1
LDLALQWISDNADRDVIFVGDYINRGLGSRQVIERLIDFREAHPRGVAFLRGNHEGALLEWLSRGNNSTFLAHGGLSTVRSYVTDATGGAMTRFVKEFPPVHAQFLQATSLAYETDDVLVSHAGLDMSRPNKRSEDILVYGRHQSSVFDNPPPGKIAKRLIFGHYVQKSMIPFFGHSGLVCIDTGCGTLPGGPLTVYLHPEGKYYQF